MSKQAKHYGLAAGHLWAARTAKSPMQASLAEIDAVERELRALPALLAACEAFVQIKNAADTGTPLVANQGQALDGYAELAAYRGAVAGARAAIALAKGESTDG